MLHDTMRRVCKKSSQGVVMKVYLKRSKQSWKKVCKKTRNELGKSMEANSKGLALRK